MDRCRQQFDGLVRVQEDELLVVIDRESVCSLADRTGFSRFRQYPPGGRSKYFHPEVAMFFRPFRG